MAFSFKVHTITQTRWLIIFSISSWVELFSLIAISLFSTVDSWYSKEQAISCVSFSYILYNSTFLFTFQRVVCCVFCLFLSRICVVLHCTCVIEYSTCDIFCWMTNWLRYYRMTSTWYIRIDNSYSSFHKTTN